MNTLYFDYQASTPVANEVLLKMQHFFTESFANPHSSDHALGWESAAAIDNAAQSVGDLIGADIDEIIFTSGATESNNLAILGLAKKAVISNSSRKRVLLSSTEHKCVLSVGRVLEDQFGFTVETIPVDRNGHISSAELERKLGDDVLLVSIMAVNNEIGTIQDIEAFSEIIKKYGSIFHCDAAQAPIAIKMDKFAEHVHMLSLSGHKMYGPKGIGALYIRRDIQEDIEPLIYGGGQQNGIRSGTLPTPLCVGMGAAAEYIGSFGILEKRKALQERRDMFIKELISLSWSTRLYGDTGDKRHPGNISIGFEGFNGATVLGALQPYLAGSTGSACTSGIPEPSHVLKAIGLANVEAEAVIRFSIGFETTAQEIHEAVELIDSALKRLVVVSERAIS